MTSSIEQQFGVRLMVNRGLGLPGGWLVIFDRRTGQPPISERTTTESATTPNGREAIVIRA